MTLTTAVSDLFQSIYELFASILSTIYAVIHAAFTTVWNFVASILSLVQSIVREAVHLTGGVGKFVASNFVALIVGGLLVFAYLRFSATPSRAGPVAQKKTR
ncbi:hypothetical protein X797_000737 [Metarhizium robertsii]|uniref:Uncharacterized protein n=2 Tax=Metarhizium robertsii TaxID=568076 RepID=E9EQB1_METRA|nr:uncharacterized protein MAA_02368 [Metarhizium robertsii ARSEF 23]EFZ02786.1 hypothetical protein MAA_02368 [Metarhizium robertsii ARSEF 23]EXV06019.1 hypothetical protein X797_000737 [Metarhizium robertsii]